MNNKLFLIGLFLAFQNLHTAIFQGLIETGVTKNNFLCSDQNGEQTSACISAGINSKGFDVSGGKTLQFFNDVTYWLSKQSQQEQLLATSKNYSGAALQSQMQSEGWIAMGAYCVVISTDPVLQKIAQPALKAAEGDIKVIVQLWYNGNNLMQLWSQDAQALTPGQSFTIQISSEEDTLNLSGNKTLGVVDTFLNNLNLQPNNRLASVYNIAVNSPRSVKIQPVIS